MINVPLQGLQKSSGLCTDRLVDAIPHNPTKNFGTTDPHRAITIANSHLS
jgi:hypothetical protein